MSGIALDRFEEIIGYRKKETPVWSVLHHAYKEGCLAYVDIALAEMLAKGCDELTAAFICHLSRSVREGHLCISKKGSSIDPDPKRIWLSDVAEELSKEVLSLIERLSSEEIDLPSHLVSKGEDSLLRPLCRFQDLYYFQKYWLFESSLIASIQNLLQQEPVLSIGDATLNQLTDEQAKAVIQSSKHCFSVLCGGPGTGKTYTAGHFIKHFWDSLSEEQRETCNIVVAAPTGKAASHLQKSLENAFGQEDVLQAKTLHSLLGIRSTKMTDEKPNKKLNADLVIVDESSMIDVRIMSYLLHSIKPGARLVLLGDPYQLPPVEAGSVFNDMIQILPPQNISQLTKCLRAELQEIVSFSQMINEGRSNEVIAHLSQSASAVTRIILDGDPLKLWIQSQFPLLTYREGDDFEELNRFRVLSPLRQGPYGVKEMNRLVKDHHFSQVKWGDHFVAPIMIVSNHYKLNLFNGEVGVLVCRKKKNEGFEEGDFAIFNGNRKVPAILLPRFEYAYCLSVHKSQGSEFDHVLLLLPEGSERFGREVFYTAATRAKKKLEVWGSDQTIEETLVNRSKRLSGISLKLHFLSRDSNVFSCN